METRTQYMLDNGKTVYVETRRVFQSQRCGTQYTYYVGHAVMPFLVRPVHLYTGTRPFLGCTPDDIKLTRDEMIQAATKHHTHLQRETVIS